MLTHYSVPQAQVADFPFASANSSMSRVAYVLVISMENICMGCWTSFSGLAECLISQQRCAPLPPPPSTPPSTALRRQRRAGEGSTAKGQNRFRLGISRLVYFGIPTRPGKAVFRRFSAQRLVQSYNHKKITPISKGKRLSRTLKWFLCVSGTPQWKQNTPFREC